MAEPSVGTSHGASAAPPAPEPFTKSLERMNYFQEPEARVLIADLELPPGSSGLDAGCGVGLYALWLAEEVGPRGRVLGIEPTASAWRRRANWWASASTPAASSSARAMRRRSAMKDGSLDWVWCGDVLHHILDTDKALSEFRRVVRPGGRVVIKESQVLSAMFLPGHPELERRIQLAEIARSLDEGGGRSFQERRQTTLASLRAAGLSDIAARSYLIERRAPLTAAAREYIQKTVFDRNWGERLRPLLSAEDWSLRTAVCEPGSPRNVAGKSRLLLPLPGHGLHGPRPRALIPANVALSGLAAVSWTASPRSVATGAAFGTRQARVMSTTALTNFFLVQKGGRDERHTAASPRQNDFRVADLSLADWGRKEIAIAEGEMPALMAIRAGVRGAAAAQGRAHRGLAAHDHPDRRAHRDAEGARRRGALGLVQHLLDPGPRGGGHRRRGHAGLRLQGRDARRVLGVHPPHLRVRRPRART